MAYDRFGRNLNYLRISLTDRCNLRCIYCMPEEMSFRENAEQLTDDELLVLVRLFADLGFEKIRFTGGEPTIRPNFLDLVQKIGSIPGIKFLTMTTNGTTLTKLAEPLMKARMKRVNISLDSLDPETYKKITRKGYFENVWAGILEAERVGMTPIKLNSVIVRGINESDAVELARLTIDRPWQIRFIEMMPFGVITDLQLKQVVTMEEVKARIEESLGKLHLENFGKLDGEARVFRLEGARGELGFISSVSDPFCYSCNRARLTADGRLRLCLLREGEVDLLTPLRSGASLDEMRELIKNSLWEKPWGNLLSEGVVAVNRTMSEIGG
ncbi:MAG: GTP 3',8-cyclase MoaA [Anaerolineales bacterium]|nr:GTP 3',8-cyclase MoaA [Anaerolineales bacterium]